MESRTDFNRTSKQILEEEVVKDEPVVIRTAKPKTAKLVLQHNIGTFVVKGDITGKEYRFYGAGYITDVEIEDVPGLLTKKRGGCCGHEALPYFSLV